MTKRKRIQADVLTDDAKVTALISAVKQSCQPTDHYEPYVEHKFLGLKGRTMKDGHIWDMAYRPNGQNPVHIITMDHRTGKYLLIAQIRPPIDGIKIVISFPAGLKKNTIESAEEVAKREMLEETGYEPMSVKVISPHPLPKSAGMTNESAEVVKCIVNPKALKVPENEGTEDIVSFWVTLDELWAMIPKLPPNVVVEYDLWMFAASRHY